MNLGYTYINYAIKIIIPYISNSLSSICVVPFKVD